MKEKNSWNITSKNLEYFDMLDSQESKMNCKVCSSRSGYFSSVLNLLLSDAAAAICRLKDEYQEYEKQIDDFVC